MSEHDDDPFDDDIDPGTDAYDIDLATGSDEPALKRTLSARQRLEERRESRWLQEMTSDWDSWDDSSQAR